MKTRNYSTSLIAIVFVLLVASCHHPTDPNEYNHTFNDLYGTWVRTGYEYDATILRKSKKLDENEYGFVIHPDGKFTERKNAGWCGTPPIAYANFEGQWKELSENNLDVAVGYWGGTISFQMEIVSLSSEQLRILYHYGG